MAMIPWLGLPSYDERMMMPMSSYNPWWNMEGMLRSMENSVRSMTSQSRMPWLNRIDHASSELVNDKEKFLIRLDVNQFKPEEMTVKATDNRIIIHGRHEEKEDGDGFIEREFTRSYWLPKDVQLENIKSEMTGDGQLMILAPKKPNRNEKERKIPIEQK